MKPVPPPARAPPAPPPPARTPAPPLDPDPPNWRRYIPDGVDLPPDMTLSEALDYALSLMPDADTLPYLPTKVHLRTDSALRSGASAQGVGDKM